MRDPQAASERIGRYQLLQTIGAGPNGSVSRAKVFGVAGFERQFAVKRFLPELTVASVNAQALSAAARAYGGLEHPRIARMSEFGVAQGQTFTAVEYVAGLDAMRLLVETKLAGVAIAIGGALALVSQAARAVGYAHGRGLAHLGLSPTNVIITGEGDVKVTDFGLLAATMPAKPVENIRLANRLAYFAPEQIAGEATSAATDVFVLGVIAYELVTGQRAYRGESSQDIGNAILAGPPPEPALPRPIVRVLQRCVARSPFERFPDARALADALDAALRVAPVPGTRKEIGAQVKSIVDRLAELAEGNMSGLLALDVGTGPTPRISSANLANDPADVATNPFRRSDPDLGASSDSAETMREIAKPFTTAAGLAPPSLPSLPSMPQPGATGGVPAIGGPKKTMIPTVIPPVKPQAGVPAIAVPRTRTEQPPTPARTRTEQAPAVPRTRTEQPPAVVPPRTMTPRSIKPLAKPVDEVIELAPFTAADDVRTSAPTIPRTESDLGRRDNQTGEMSSLQLQDLQRRAIATSELESMTVEESPDPDPPSVAAPMPVAPTPTPAPVPVSAEPAAAPALPDPPAAPPYTGEPAIAEVKAPAPAIVEAPAAPSSTAAPARKKTGLWIALASVAIVGGGAAAVWFGVLDTGASKAPAPVARGGGSGSALAVASVTPKVASSGSKAGSGSAVLVAPIDSGVTASAGSGSSAETGSAAGSGSSAIAAAGSAGSAGSGSSAATGSGSAAAAVVAAGSGAGSAAPTAGKPIVTPIGASDSLQIASTPAGAHVFLDGADQGVTPMKLAGSADRHNVALLLAGHELYVAEVEGHGQFNIELKPVTPHAGEGGIKVLKCKDKDRYYVFVDGRPTGMMCPTERINVEVGPHTVEVYDAVSESRQKWDIRVNDTRLSVRVRIDEH